MIPEEHLFSLMARKASICQSWVSENLLPRCSPTSDQSILIDTIHDGYLVPDDITHRHDASTELESEDFLAKAFQEVRDWGANLVAEMLARELGLKEYHRVSVARSVVDLGRLPGVTMIGEHHMSRKALSSRLGEILTEKELAALLTKYYEPMWRVLVDRVEQCLSPKGSSQYRDGMRANSRAPVVRIGVHTFDQFGPEGRERPPISLLTGPFQYDVSVGCSVGNEDDLVKASVRESTADPLLVRLILEACNEEEFEATWNEPYQLPEGSAEVRLHNLFFLYRLRRRFERERPGRTATGLASLWEILYKSPQRFWNVAELREHLESDCGHEDLIEEYSRIIEFERVAEVGEEYVKSYRPFSTLALEVRKDLVCEYNHDNPVLLNRDGASHIVRAVASGVRRYFDRWCEEAAPSRPA